MKTGRCAATTLFLLLWAPYMALCADSSVKYTIQDLGRGVKPLALNNRGGMAGTIISSETGHEAFLYEAGALTPLGKLGGMGSSAYALNDHGDLLATVCSDTACADFTGTYPVLIKDGQVTDLRATSARLKSAHGINNSGQIVGRSTGLSDHVFTEVTTVVLYDYLNDTAKVIWKPFNGWFPAGECINNLGEVVYIQAAAPMYDASFPYLYRNGASYELESVWVSYDMNDRGQIVGITDSGSIFYDNGLTRIPWSTHQTLGTIRFLPLALNNEALMVGRANAYHSYPATYKNGELTILDNSLLISDDDWGLVEARDVNDRGQIIGYGTKNGEADHGFIMTPIAATRYPVTLTIDGTGGGSVHGAMSCLGGAACPPQSFNQNSLVYLVPSPDAFSLFGGWKGDCPITANTCLLTMTGPKSVTATFNAAPRVRIAGRADYSLISSAFSEAPDNAVISAIADVFNEALIVLERSVRLTLKGGYNAGFTLESGVTAVKGKLVIRNGTLRVSHVALI